MAAYIEQDSELFTNLVPAQAIPSGKVFYAFRDSIGAPGVFSLGTDSVLNLFVQKDGKLQNTNFAEACGFSDPVTAVAVRQAHDSSLFIAFSLDKSGTNQIVVLPKLALSDLSAPDPSNVILSGTNLPQVHGIFMVSKFDTTCYHANYYRAITPIPASTAWIIQMLSLRFNP